MITRPSRHSVIPVVRSRIGGLRKVVETRIPTIDGTSQKVRIRFGSLDSSRSWCGSMAEEPTANERSR